jgi:hypothetical protein
MEYVNLQTGIRIDINELSATEKEFYRRALRKFQENTDWVAFDEFAFGMKSPIYDQRRSHLDVLKSPLYLALKDMSLQLGIQQGLISLGKSEKSVSA